jgi:hypothetical protein
VPILVIVYTLGVLIALWRTDARLLDRFLLALLWPIGPLAFVVTTLLLVAASPFAFLPRRS